MKYPVSQKYQCKELINLAREENNEVNSKDQAKRSSNILVLHFCLSYQLEKPKAAPAHTISLPNSISGQSQFPLFKFV
jgi:hypothetical protein